MSTSELKFVKEESIILMESDDLAFNKQKSFEQEILLKVALFIKVATSDKRNNEELIFSKTESLMLREPELAVKMGLLEDISLI